ncbi:MAG TPA: hypothetical protein VMZ69_08620 [Saprospiraceae bacterium]|nr:hypothetical protein [Saprospiraceae bacterium]
MQNRWKVIIISTASLLLGALLYSATRSESIYLNQFVSQFGDGAVLRFFQKLIHNTDIPEWIIYSLPDGLWMFALILLILMLWDFKLNKGSFLWVIIAFFLGILFEALQGLHIVRGTFDIIDIYFILIAVILPILYLLLKPNKWIIN